MQFIGVSKILPFCFDTKMVQNALYGIRSYTVSYSILAFELAQQVCVVPWSHQIKSVWRFHDHSVIHHKNWAAKDSAFLSFTKQRKQQNTAYFLLLWLLSSLNIVSTNVLTLNLLVRVLFSDFQQFVASHNLI